MSNRTGSPTGVVADPRPGPRSDSGVGPGRRRTGTALRVVSHLAAEVPLVVLAVIELARGWRPVYDNADLALRSFQVFSSHSPLVGHQMAVSAGSRAVFGPGPIQNWLLAVPVRIDPAQGALWGALVAVVAAVALTVEAGSAVAGWRGAAVASGSVLVLLLARTDVALDVAWNVWFGLCFLLAAVGSSVAAATGRLRWWPVAVVAATVTVQCQAAFAPPAVAVCVVAPVLGIAVRRHRSGAVEWAWLVVGLGVGVAGWIAPAAQQAADHPGNLTLIARAARGSGPSIGWPAALRAFGGATRVPPSWAHALPASGTARYVAVAGSFSGPAGWGVVVLAALTVVSVVAWWAGRTDLAACAAVTLALSGGAVAAIAVVPGSQFLVVGYLGALWVPVATAVWITAAWAAWELVAVARRRWWPSPGRAESGTLGGGARIERTVAVVVAVGLLLGSGGVVRRGLDGMDGTTPTLAGWTAVHAAAAGADAAARVAPSGPFRLEVAGPTSATQFAVLTGVAYLLVTRGLDPRPDPPVTWATFGHPPVHGPVVVLELPGGSGAVRAQLRRS